jgi:hypothetical protein
MRHFFIYGLLAVVVTLSACTDAGGPTTLSGVAACHTMITSLNKNRKRVDELVFAPLLKHVAP